MFTSAVGGSNSDVATGSGGSGSLFTSSTAAMHQQYNQLQQLHQQQQQLQQQGFSSNLVENQQQHLQQVEGLRRRSSTIGKTEDWKALERPSSIGELKEVWEAPEGSSSIAEVKDLLDILKSLQIGELDFPEGPRAAKINDDFWLKLAMLAQQSAVQQGEARLG